MAEMNIENVILTLQNASCQQPHLIKPAEELLESWERKNGFYHTLLQVYMNQSVDLNARWLALLCFKNGLDKYWRTVSKSDYKIVDEEKEFIKSTLITLCFQPEMMNRLALQLSVCIGKIARQDSLSNWPQLLPALMKIIAGEPCTNEQEENVKGRALLSLHHTIKQMSSRRLMIDRRKFQEVVHGLFPEIHVLYKREVENLVQCQDQGADNLTIENNLKRSHGFLKIIRKMAAYGFKVPSDSPALLDFFDCIFIQIKPMLWLRKQHANDALKEKVEKYINVLMKCVNEFLSSYPGCFLKYLQRTLETIITFCFAELDQDLLYDQFTLHLIKIFNEVLTCAEYKVFKKVEDTKSSEALEAHRIKEMILTPSVLERICYVIITKYLVMSKEALMTWDQTPENFCIELDCERGYEFSLRDSTETLFTTLVQQYKESFKPVINNLLMQSMHPVNPSDIAGILKKDAVYNAAGLSSFEFFDEINFDEWFQNHLANELKVTDSNYRILRRGIIRLVGQWLSVSFSQTSRVFLYEVFVHMLSNDTDFVVRFDTAKTVRTAIDDFDFNRENFMPYMPSIFSSIFNLLKEANECDAKMQLLNVLSIMIEVVGPEINKSSDLLIRFVPELWAESEEHNMLRCSIVSTLKHLVVNLGADSVGMSEFLFQVIYLSTDMNNSSHVYLMEDGLELWACLIENTATPNGSTLASTDPNVQRNPPPAAFYERLLELYSNCLPLLESFSDYLQTCIQITIAYILLMPVQFLQKYGTRITEVLTDQFSDLHSEPRILVLRVFEAIMKTTGRDGVLLVRGSLSMACTGMLKEHENLYPAMLSSLLSMLSRVLLSDYDSFLWIVNQISKAVQNEDAMTELLRIWCSRMTMVTPIERSKLVGLGLCRIVASGSPSISLMCTRAIECVVEVIYNLMNEDEDLDSDTVLLEDDPSCSNSEDECTNEHEFRKYNLCKRDPVFNVRLRRCLMEALAEFEKHSSPEAIQKIMANLNDDARNIVLKSTTS